MPPTPPPPVQLDLSWPIPKLKLRIDDLDHEGVGIFLKAIDPNEALRQAVMASFEWLYALETVPRSVQEITLVLVSMPGVAHTTGSKTHKEIYYSLDYIVETKDRAEDEINGVLVHEVVHCFQHNGQESCPTGFTEGIADYVRLNAGYAPPHWQKRFDGDWDAGYDLTAYFLDWIEKCYGTGTIKKLNLSVKKKYKDDRFEELTGKPLKTLWESYCACQGKVDNDVALKNEMEVNVNVDEFEETENAHWALTQWPVPKFDLRVDDLDHDGVDVFFEAVNAKDVLHRAVMASFSWLYTIENVPREVKEIRLVLRPMDGVAYTTGNATHKEIHFSLDYIKKVEHRGKDEITGVLVHEVVHCYQHTGRDTCPGGLIEGVADFVRLSEKLGPPHWSTSHIPDKWDAGYEATAYFLQWIDDTFGQGTIQNMNAHLKDVRYQDKLFEELTAVPLDELWLAYVEFRRKENEQKPALVVQKDEN